MFCSVFVRRLKEGASFEQFREAWEPEPGHFGMPVRVVHARCTDDEREILSFSLLDVGADELHAVLRRTAEGEALRHDSISEVIETTVTAGI